MSDEASTLSWLDKPHEGDAFTYQDKNGQPRQLPIRYPTVTATARCIAEEMRPHIFCSSFDLSGFHFCNRIDIYSVIEPGNAALLVDTGRYDLCGVDFLHETLQRTGTPWEATDIFITHLHDDHTGNVPYCFDQGARHAWRGRCEPYSRAAVEAYLRETGALDANDEDLGTFAELLLGKDNPLYETSPSITEVDAGHTFALAEYCWEVIETPGHTADHTCLVERDHKLLFAGDHVLDAAPGVMQFHQDQRLLARFLESFAELKRCRLETVFMSHHEPLEGTDTINAFFDRIVDTYAQPIEKMAAVVAETGPCTIYEVTAAYYSHLHRGLAAQPAGMRSRRVSTAFGYLEYLADTGQARRHVSDSGALIYEKAN